MTSITRHLDRADVPAHLRGAYTGARFKAHLTSAVTIPATAGLWDGGSRDEFTAIRLSDGAAMNFPIADHMDTTQRDRRVTLEAGYAIVRRSTFQGRDMGLEFYMLPEDAAPLLPAPGPQLSDLERAVLRITRDCVSSYRQDEARRQGIGPRSWTGAQERLAEFGLLNARGAITTAGKNALAGA